MTAMHGHPGYAYGYNRGRAGTPLDQSAHISKCTNMPQKRYMVNIPASMLFKLTQREPVESGVVSNEPQNSNLLQCEID